MAEYIKRETAIAKLTALEVTDGLATMADAKRVLADMPAEDVVPMVRCKDCKHGTPVWNGIVLCGHPEYDLLDGMIDHEEEHFCGYGERSDDNG